jgi:hypothetical protein
MAAAIAIERNPAQGIEAGIVCIEVGEDTASLQAQTEAAGSGRHHWNCLDRDAHGRGHPIASFGCRDIQNERELSSWDLLLQMFGIGGCSFRDSFHYDQVSHQVKRHETRNGTKLPPPQPNE